MEFYGYTDCIELRNAHARVVITPHGGARVLLYALPGGENAIHLDDGKSLGGKFENGEDAHGEAHAGWTWGGNEGAPGDPFGPTGGRFDVGPEFQATGPDLRQGGHCALFLGTWGVDEATETTACLTSPVCANTGLQLVRQFVLAAGSSELTTTQTMRNVTERPTLRVSHWGRTFVPGGGVALVGLPEDGYSRFPKKFVTYAFGSAEGGHAVLFDPADETVRVRDGCVEITAHTRTKHHKIGMDSSRGWMAYISPTNSLLVKRFAVDPRRVYGEVAGLTCCVFYYRDRLVEMEPIGPLETLAPGQQASFTERWTLHPFDLPLPGKDVDIAKVTEIVAALGPSGV